MKPSFPFRQSIAHTHAQFLSTIRQNIKHLYLGDTRLQKVKYIGVALHVIVSFETEAISN
jgi:hypothetical protein